MASSIASRWKAIITPSVENGGVEEDIKKQVGGSLDGAGKSLGGKLGKGLKIGAAAGIAAVGAGVAGLGAMTAKALSAQAEIQQSLGGSEAVFEQNSGAIQQWAAAAAGSMGISTNAALETANKMGSLFQGSGIGIQESAEMTMNMSKRAADVASIMGVDLESAMEAVTGAAKGNFTMMDNLGVAMNATTLEAYAASKGIDATWNSMSNAEKTGLAYQMFMEKTSKYAGNFEKENQTLQGSLDILSSSWENLFYSLGDPAMLESALGQMKNAIVNVVTSISEVLPTILTNMGTMISELIPILLNAVQTLLPQIAQMLATELPKLITQIANALPGLIETLFTIIDMLLPVLLDAIVNIGVALLNALPGLITSIMNTLILGFPLVLDAAIKLLMAIIDALPVVIIALVQALPTLIEAIAKAWGSALPQITTAGVKLMTGLVDALPIILPALLGAVVTLLGSVIYEIIKNAPAIMNAGHTAFMGLLTSFNDLAWYLDDAIRGFFSKVPGWIGSALSGLKSIGGDLIRGIWEGMKNMGGWFANNVKNWGGGVVNQIKGFFGIHSPSRLMRDQVGKQIGAGVGVGLMQSSRKVLRDARNFSNTISNGIDIGSRAQLDFGTNGGIYDDNGFGSTNVTVNQTVEQPKNMMDMYLITRRGAVQGTQLAGAK